MNDLFTFSIDWGRVLFDSAIWIARAWAIAAVCTLVVLVLIARYTTWGRQFWRITGAYFTGPHSVKVWLWLAALLLSVIVGVRLNVLFSYQGNDMRSHSPAAAPATKRSKSLASTAFIPRWASSRSWPPCTSPASCSTCS